MTKKIFDISTLNTTNKRLLVKDSREESQQDRGLVAKKKKDHKPKKAGRPMSEDGLLDKKVTVNFTQSELTKLERKAGLIPLSKYLRNFLKESKIF